ncbi:vWA domain-containing protein [Rhodobacter ferrooxidans]|uniref:von Willebrand factor type A n=1 Tax=Rhodobacter ferrooxidans TaxID=371731 RepID=C8S1M5_9RHOB|nr:VWA domain-containing protein [Rhodobacter sp. SW2]EEW25198.1 von Willebrand factor type A [Rhodobacter sp. SW2]
MMDEFDRLQAALRQAPAPEATAKAEAIALAMKNFDHLQGSPSAARPNSDRPEPAGFLNGVFDMLKSLGTTRVLAATTSVAAICVGLVVVLPLIGDLNLPVPKPAVQQAAPVAPLAETPVQPPAEPGRVRQDVDALTAAPQTPVLPELTPELITEPMADTAAAPEPAMESADAMAAPMAGAPAPAFKTAPGGMVGLAMPEMAPMPLENTEEFSSAPVNPVKVTAEEPVSTFSIDVDTASYAVVRSSLNAGYLPEAEAVRVEEMVNYFPYAYAAPVAGEAPFRTAVTVMQTPWNPGTRLVRIGLQGRLPALDDRPPLNLVFLIDTSGSMEDANKLPLLKQSLRLMLAELRPEDQVAIVAYAGSAGEILPPTKAENADEILAALDRLGAGGSTAGAEGLALAYQVARKMAGAGEVSRVLLATDGDFNVGIDDPEGLTKYIAKQRDTGVYLSVLGFGRGNLDDATMQALAQNGNGTAAYIDTLNEARKVLVDQLTGALFPIADDVKIQVEWNPAAVAEYRLIGYETRALRREDFNNDKVDAGEIGAGTAVTALYEVTAPGSAALRNDPLRYGTAQPLAQADELGFLRLRYKAPGEDVSALIETPIQPATSEPDADARFAVAIAGFGQLLTGSTYLGDWGWDQAIELALGARGDDPYGYRIEAVNLMRMAQTLAQ